MSKSNSKKSNQNKQNSKKPDPTSCKVNLFLQYYRNYEVEEKKDSEHDVCWFYKKNSYYYAQVRQVLRTMKSSHSRTHNKLNLHYYKCPYCNSNHLTSEKTHKKYRSAA